MTTRMCFRPYLYDPALENTLGKIRLPTLIVWGKQDQIVPLECAERYQRAIVGAQLRILDPCGHLAHLEQPTLLARSISEFSPS
jgi:pimeloyl-ACP methyl ester carboxylesterase